MSGAARVLVASVRDLHPTVDRACAYEYEDVIAAIDDVELVRPRPVPRRVPRPLQRAFELLHDGTGLAVGIDPRVETREPRGSYELFFAAVQSPRDLILLPQWRRWASRCRVSVCWLEELWLGWLDYRKLLRPLRHFDHVIINCSATAQPLAERIGRPCSYAPPGVDALRFCPCPPDAPRTIDVYAMGRRSPETHRALLELSRAGRIVYHFDSARPREFAVDAAEHRELLAGLIGRSRYFVANLAKVTHPDHTGAQEEVGFRFFEGAAGGAVLIGEPPRCAPFDEHFDWPDAVIRLPYGSTEVGALLERLDADPARLERIRRDNVRNSLLRHDWVYRWERVLEVAGLEPGARLAARKARLARVADRFVG